MANLKDFITAQKLDKIIETKINNQLDKKRPAAKYAVVKSINNTERYAEVVYVGEPDDNLVKVPFGVVGPSEVGQEVRIEGTPGDRYIAGIRGTSKVEQDAENAGNSATDAGNNANAANDGVSAINDTLSGIDGRPLWDGPDNTGNSSIPWINASDDIGMISTSARWAFIRARKPVKYTSITFAAKIASGTVTSLYFDIYRIAADFSAALIYSSDNKAGPLSGSYQWFTYAFPEIVVNYSEFLAVQMRCAGGGNCQLAGKVDRTIANTVFRPRYIGGVRDSSVTPTPAAFTQSELDSVYFSAIPYIQLGSFDNALSGGKTISDNFNNTLSQWFLRTTESNNLVIEDGRLAYNGSNDGRQMGIMISPLNTSKFNVSALVDPNSRDSYMLAASDVGMNNFLAVTFNENDIKIYTVTGGPGGTWTSRATTGSGSNSSAKRTLTHDGTGVWKVFEGTPVLGTEKLTWDSGGTFTAPDGRRFTGLGIERYFFNNGAKWDDFTAKDVENNYE